MMKRGKFPRLLAVLLAVCLMLSLASVTALADGVNYIDRIDVAYDLIDYQAGDAPRATASVTEGQCTVAYEYWREIHQKEAGGVWSGTGRYWYSDPDKMAALPADKRITQFEAGKHYSYNIVLTTSTGFFISDDTTVVSVGEYEWGTPGRSTNLEIKNMSTRLNVYGIYAIDIPEDSTDQVITDVSIINVNKDLDASTPVSFTAKAAAWCADEFDVIEEGWEAGGSIHDVIKSTDAPRTPIAGGEYWYGIVLRAKDGYVFSPDFSDENFRIKKGSEVTFTLGGYPYSDSFALSDDGKTLTAWEFMDPVTAKDSTQPGVISSVQIENAILSYAPAEAPKAAATVGAADASKYSIHTEGWEKKHKDENDILTTVAYWYSNDSYYREADARFISFERGVKYRYSLWLTAKEGYTFRTDLDENAVTLNGLALPFGSFVTVLDSGKTCHITYGTNMRPGQRIDKICVNGAKTAFVSGDEPVFTGKPASDLYFIDHERWDTEGAGITSSDYWNERYENRIQAFEFGKAYTYSIYLKLTDAGYSEGWYFDKDTKLVINNQEVSLSPEQIDVDDEGEVIWFSSVLAMTPEAAPAPDYRIIEGVNGAWTQGSGTELIFRANGEFGKFTEVQVDGSPLSGQQYTAVSGSTVVSLKAEYLATLPVGGHTLTVVYTDGRCSTGFEIKAAPTGGSTPEKPNDGAATPTAPTGESTAPTTPTVPNGTTSPDKAPDTGDSGNLILWVLLLLVSVGILTTAVISGKSRKHTGF